MRVDSLGDRMKEYEAVPKNRLIRRMPAILRLDGRAFHTLTQNFEKPFDGIFTVMMSGLCTDLLQEVQTSIFMYCQSDEISILLKDYSDLETQAWFGGQIQKIVSISAAFASVQFSRRLHAHGDVYRAAGPAMFDARVFNIPVDDVVNYFIWRQHDATRNSINALGQANFKHEELQGKSQADVLNMLHEKEISWNRLGTEFKRGFAVYRGEFPVVDFGIPIFTEDRNFISRFV